MTNAQTKSQRESWETVSLVVRFYRGVSPNSSEWRGQVEHIQSGGKFSFQGVEQLVQIMGAFSDGKTNQAKKISKGEEDEA